MFLHDVFMPELIKIGLDSEDKNEVFEELVNHFCESQKRNDREQLLEILWNRESKMSTGIKKGIAIPHGKSAAIKKVNGIIGISKKGIDYDAMDGQPVYIIFMFFVPLEDSEEYLRLLKHLTKLLDNSKFYTEMLAQNDPQGVKRIIKKYEDIYIASK